MSGYTCVLLSVEEDRLTLKVLATTIDAHRCELQRSGMGEDGGCRVGEVWASTTSPMPNHKSFKLQYW